MLVFNQMFSSMQKSRKMQLIPRRKKSINRYGPGDEIIELTDKDVKIGIVKIFNVQERRGKHEHENERNGRY